MGDLQMEGYGVKAGSLKKITSTQAGSRLGQAVKTK